MAIDFSSIKKMQIPVKVGGVTVSKYVKKIEDSSGTTIWKGTWSYTINLGAYVSKVKYSVDNSTWTSITANTTLEIDSGKTLYIKAETYSSEPRTYQYSYTMTDYNFDITRTETNDGGNVTVYRTATPVVNTYSISGTYTNGSITYYKENVHTTVITSAKYGDTIYYVGTPNTGYSGDISGSFIVNETNMTLNKTNLTATKDFGSASRIYYTATWKWQSSYGTWTTTTQSYEYGATPSRTSPGTVTSGNTRDVFSSWDNLSPLYSNRTITAVYNTQYNVTIEAVRSVADKSSGWFDSGTVVTWTADTDYSFAEGTTRTTTTTATINSGGIYSKSADYYYITVSGTNCSADVSTGYRLIGATITWTADSSDGTYYSFESDSYIVTTTATTAVGTSNYSKTASYIYYYITVNATNCYVSSHGSGYYPAGATVSTFWKVNDVNTQTFDPSQTSSFPTSSRNWTSTKNRVVSSPTVYTRLYIVTFSGTYGSWSTASMNVEYNTSASKSGLVVTVGSSTSTFTKKSDTAQYSYSNASVGTVPSKITSHTTITGSATRTLRSYSVTAMEGAGLSSVYLSTNSSATSGDPTGTAYNYGTTVYLFGVALDGYYSTETYIGGGAQYEAGAIYRLGSVVVDGPEDFGTVAITRNPFIKINFVGGSYTLDGETKSPSDVTYVKYNSEHSIELWCDPGHYLETDWGTRADSMTINGNTTVYTTTSYSGNVTSNIDVVLMILQYFTWSFIGGSSIPFSGTIEYSNGYIQTIDYRHTNMGVYYTGTIKPNITFRSIEVYGSTGEKTNWGKLYNGEYPFAYNSSDDKIITSYSGTVTSTTPLTNNWLGSGSAYHKVTVSGTYNQADRISSCSGTDSAAAYISGVTHNTTIRCSSTSKTYNVSGNTLVFTNYSYASSGALICNDDSYNISPATFSFGDSSSSPRTTNVSYSIVSWSITLLGGNFYPELPAGYSYMTITYTDSLGTSRDVSISVSRFHLTISGQGAVAVKCYRSSSGSTGDLSEGTYFSSCISSEWFEYRSWTIEADNSDTITFVPKSGYMYACVG